MQAAAALAVGVGSFLDPKDVQVRSLRCLDCERHWLPVALWQRTCHLRRKPVV